MGRFKIDNQTLSDINIFLKEDSIYRFFNRTKTKKASIRLKEMMDVPFTDIIEISLRRDILVFIKRNNIKFDFSDREIDFIDYYLESEKKFFNTNLIETGIDFLSRKSNTQYYIIKTGLGYVISLVQYLSKLILELSGMTDIPELMSKLIDRVSNIFKADAFLKILSLHLDKVSYRDLIKLDKSIRNYNKEDIIEILEMVYQFDIFETLCRVANEKGFSFAEYTDEAEISVEIKGLFNVSIDKPITNDIIMDHQNSLFILTGSNMSGKSSLLKSIGVAIYLSHLGFPVPAAFMKTSIFNGLTTSINLPDNINEGLSHYYSEVRRIKNVSVDLLKSDRIFIIFDEFFRGTNIKDAFEASLLITKELAFIKNSFFIISTHIVELAVELKQLGNVGFLYLETLFDDHGPIFTYKLKNGISEDRVGMYILNKEKVLENLRKVVQNRVANT